MNNSRQEFSSRSKNFSSNANKSNGWHPQGRKKKQNLKKNQHGGTQNFPQKNESPLDSRDFKEVQNIAEKQHSQKIHGNRWKSNKPNQSKNKPQSTNNRAPQNAGNSVNKSPKSRSRAVNNDENVNKMKPKLKNKVVENEKSASTMSKKASKPKMEQQQAQKERILENVKNVNKELPKQEQLFTNISDTGMKRKNKAGLDGSKQSKKTKVELSESDSDADDYIDKFFLDVSDGDELETTGCSGSSQGTIDQESDYETVSEEDLSQDEDDSNTMSFEQLLDHYGNNRDRDEKILNGAGVKGKKSKIAAKKASVCKKSNSSTGNEWIEEENDVRLEYDDSDNEQVGLSKALVLHSDALIETSEDDDDYALKELEEEEEGSSDEDDTITSDMESLSDEGDYEFTSDSDSEEGDYGTEGSDIDSDEGESDSSEESDSDSEESDSGTEDEDPFNFSSSYDSENDESYVPPDDDDLFIGRGEAMIYEIDDNNVSFNSDIDTAQIVELPSDSDGRILSAATSYEESQTDDDRGSCPELVPIYDDTGRLIDCSKMLTNAMRKEKESPKKSSLKMSSSEKEVRVENTPVSIATALAPPEDMETDQEETFVSARKLCELSLSQNDSNQNKASCDAEIEIASDSADITENINYHFYDSIDKRMSLLVLEEPIHFSGHLTIQPLIGSVEVMGYHFRRGECRNVYAVRGYHCLNLSPHPEKGEIPNDIMEEVLTRLDKHFLNFDLEELKNTFNPVNSVLILLQADCSNNKISVAEKYLPQEALFPKLENLRDGSSFSTEYLLNAEFFTEHLDKRTSLYQCDPEWENIELKRNSKIVVMGGKGAGKSTLCQYLINKSVRKFKKVVLIDLDIGQPLQHIPETISVTVITKPLLGVATFEPVAPMKAWLFGSLDVVSSPIFYIQNIRQLLLYCQQNNNELANIPWIVNTMGYVIGFGEELMAAVLRILNPTDVIQLVAANRLLAITNFQNTLNSNFINQYNFNILRSEVQEFSQRKVSFRHHQLNVCYLKKGFTLDAPKRRNLMLLAHLANILDDSSAEWFNEVRPFCAPLSKLQVLITREDQSLSEDQLPSVLNAMLVYLCRKADNATYECLGIGIVRGVDKKNNVYLLQSLPGEVLAEVTVLAICSSNLPNSVFLQQSARIQGSIPYVYNVE